MGGGVGAENPGGAGRTPGFLSGEKRGRLLAAGRGWWGRGGGVGWGWALGAAGGAVAAVSAGTAVAAAGATSAWLAGLAAWLAGLACAWALHAGHEFVHGEFAVVIFVEGFEGGGGVFDFFLGEFAVFVFVEGFHEGERHHAALTAIGRSAWVGRAAVGRAAWAGRRGAGLWWGRGGVLGAGEAEGGGEDDGGEDPCVHGWMGVVGGLEVTDMGGFRGGAGADRESESGVDCVAASMWRLWQ